MSRTGPYQLDTRRLRRNLECAAARFDRASALHREVGARLLERLELIRLEPAAVLDLGCATGITTAGLFRHYRKARIIGLEQSPAMLQQARRQAPWLRALQAVCADPVELPLADHAVELVFSNLALQWSSDLDRTIAECWRVLAPGGLLLFSLPGPDTLRELRAAWARIDDRVHVHAFIDMHDIGDALLRAQFADPVMDVEHFTLTYPDLAALLGDLRDLGATNVAAGQPRGLIGRERYRALREACEHWRSDGRLPATVEVAYGHAWKPDTVRSRTRADGAAVFPLSGLRRPRA